MSVCDMAGSSAACFEPDVRSPGRVELIADVRGRFPDALDESFVAEHRDEWLS